MALGSWMSRRGLRSRVLEVIVRENEGGSSRWASAPMIAAGFSTLGGGVGWKAGWEMNCEYGGGLRQSRSEPKMESGILTSMRGLRSGNGCEIAAVRTSILVN